MLLTAFVIGLGYGPSTPAGSDLLMRVVPVKRRATIFSIKQAGVPLGGFVAGLLVPAVALLAGGVMAALLVMAVMPLAAAVALGFWKGSMDEGPVFRPALHWHSLLLAPLHMFALLLASPRLRLITAAGFALGISQGVIMAFFPVFLSDHAGYSIAAAGSAFALLQGVGIVGRVAMGWLSDRLGDPVRVLFGLCLASGAMMVLLATISSTSSTLWVAVLSVLTGLSVVSWNGVFLTGLAEFAPEGRVGEITSAGTFVLFSGYVLCPLLFQIVFTVTEGYATGLLLSGLAPIIAGVALTVGMARRRKGFGTKGGLN